MSKEFKLDKNWHLQPIPGDTGQAYMGIMKEEKVFVKRNTSPFLAALSQEGLTPKLVWTRRTGNGDVFTAQEWLDGNILTPEDVQQSTAVIQLLQHLHHSTVLKSMLYRVGGQEVSAFKLLCRYIDDLPAQLQENDYLVQVFRYLEDHLPYYPVEDYVACHGDANHRNWMMSENGRLYLVDWDSALIGDPAIDLGTILGRYISFDQWEKWLIEYQAPITLGLIERIYWYASMNQLLEVKKQYVKCNFQKMNEEILLLRKIFSNDVNKFKNWEK